MNVNNFNGVILLARPTKWRKIENIPTIPYFIPSENHVPDIPENTLKLEELEAIRLKDLEGLEQEECAQRMEVSRPTFQRILLAAREKIADSLINGKTLHIEGGKFTRNICPVRCAECGKEWLESIENLEAVKAGNFTCTVCGSVRVDCGHSCEKRSCRRKCRKQV